MEPGKATKQRMRKNRVQTENLITAALEDKVATNRWGAEVAKSWHESTKMVINQRDRAVELLKEHLATGLELFEPVEHLTQELANVRMGKSGNEIFEELIELLHVRWAWARLTLDPKKCPFFTDKVKFKVLGHARDEWESDQQNTCF